MPLHCNRSRHKDIEGASMRRTAAGGPSCQYIHLKVSPQPPFAPLLMPPCFEPSARNEPLDMLSGKGSTRWILRCHKAAIATASSFGAFLNIVSSGNLSSYAEDKGLTNFASRSKEEIVIFLLDDICGTTTNFDEGAAKSALDKLLNELLGDVNSSGEIDELLQNKIVNDGIECILISFFGTYIFEHLSQPIQERLFERKGQDICHKTMDEIRNFIDSELETINSTSGIETINWDNPNDCERVSKKIFDNVLKIFGDE